MRFLPVENCSGGMKPPPGVGSSAIVLISHSQWSSPQWCSARSFPSLWKEMQNHLAAGHGSAQALQAAQEQWMQAGQSRDEDRLPSVSVLSQRHRNCWCLMPCAAPEQQESAVSHSKTIFPIKESAAAWLTFQNALKSALEKEGRELCLEQNFHENLQLSLF